MRDPMVRSPQRRLTFERQDLWPTLPDPDRCQCRALVGQLLRAVLQAEAPTTTRRRSDDERETAD